MLEMINTIKDFSFQEPIHLRNRELLIFKAQLQRSVEDAQRQVDEKNARERLQTPRMSSPVNA